jgi:hypothetical protein
MTSRHILALAILSSVVPLFAQEIPRVPVERETPREERGREGSPTEVPKPNSHSELSVEEFRALMHPSSNSPALRMELRWNEGSIPAVKNAEDFLRSDSRKTIISTGALPADRALRQQWRTLNDKYPDRIITHEPESANKTRQSISAAIALGDRPLNPATVRIFNALPQERELHNFSVEQNRMLIGGTPETWRKLNEEIQKQSAGFKEVKTATRTEILEEFRTGTSSTMILYAHYSDGHLYMPGAHGGSISIEEIKQIVRNDPGAKNRVIILAACSTGARTADTRSLTSVLLENGIAGSVMATDRPYDAKLIPGLIERLKSGVPLRQAGAQGQPENQGQSGVHLQQYVELRWLHPGDFAWATAGEA